MFKQIRNSKNYSGILLMISLVWTCLIYFSVISFDFVNWDDNAYVYLNKDISSMSFTMLEKIFSTFYLGMYQPLTMLSFATEYYFFGLNASAFHTVNLCLHLMNVLLVFIFIYKLSADNITAFVVSLLFGIHPMHVESVAWISERKDVLYGFFYLLAIISYNSFINTGKSKYSIVAMLMFIASLLSKSAAVTLPLVMLLLHYYHQRKDFRLFQSVYKLLPFFLISLFFGILSFFSQKTFENPDISGNGFGIFNQFVIAGFAFTSYVVNFFYPLNFAAVHPLPMQTGLFLPLMYYVGFFVSSIIVFLILLWYRKQKINDIEFELIFGVLFFLFTIFLILYNPASKAVFADRYTYLPYIGLFYSLYKGIEYISVRIFHPKKHATFVVVFVILILSGIYSVKAYSFIGNWRNAESLWNATLLSEPSPVAYFSRAMVRKDMGDTKGAKEDYKTTINLNEHFFQAYTNLAAISIEENNFSEALIYLNKVLSLVPTLSEGYYNRGLVYDKLGKNKEAIAEFSKAIEINKAYEMAYYARANGLVQLNLFNEAFHDASMCILLNPDAYFSYALRGYILFKQGSFNDALSDLNRAIKIKPDYAVAFNNRGMVFRSMTRYNEAMADFNYALKLDPIFYQAMYNRAKLFIEMKEYAKACTDLRKANSGGIKDAGLLIPSVCN